MMKLAHLFTVLPWVTHILAFSTRKINCDRRQLDEIHSSRSSFLSNTAACLLTASGIAIPQKATAEELSVFKLASGLKYVDLKEGTGPTPKYGQIVSVAYTGYLKLPSTAKNPDPQPEQFDFDEAFVYKHGNGRVISGLDEGIHTIKVGGTRRLLIPPKLGYVDIGLGPVPAYPWDRSKLNRLLGKMVEQKGGTLVFQVTLNSIIDDEADQGYYQDASLTPEEFATLRKNLQQRAKDGKASILPSDSA